MNFISDITKKLKFRASLFLALTSFVFVVLIQHPTAAEENLFSNGNWQKDGLVNQRFEINGTKNRNNPLKRRLKKPFRGDNLFVRYRLRYDSSSIDTADKNDGEFFVLWLDEIDGGNANTHSGGVPNLGIHVSGNKNNFMARYASGGERFADELVGDQDVLLVGRLWKSKAEENAPFDQFDFWVNPKPDEEFSPAGSARSSKAIQKVNWIGFSTGRKTEADDRITVWDISLAETWHEIMGLPAPAKPPKHATPPTKTVSFVKDVLPILESRCFECHAGAEPDSELRLDVLDEMINQTAPRNASASPLIKVIEEGEMPPEGDPVTEQELNILRAWINEGLEWDEARLPTPAPETEHWAFQPIQRPEIPKVKNSKWIKTAVDSFIASQHEKHGLAPAAEANPETLARRLSLDLTGLPPNPDNASVTVDDLLKNPAYGQRWGRHWLDVARWAESNGHQHNNDRPHAWRYRDWVVDAFNSDMPYDQFIREQIAGDEFATSDGPIVATGFLSAARYSGNELDKEIQRNDILVDVANTTAKAFLGLTLECAQCHTHKFDPISIRDYYRFQAFFVRGQPVNVVLKSNDEDKTKSLVAERWQIFDTVRDRLINIRRKRGVADASLVTPEAVAKAMNAKEKARFKKLDDQIALLPQSWSYYSSLQASNQRPTAAHVMRSPLPHDLSSLAHIQTHLLVRGDVKSPGPEVAPGWPVIFGPTPAKIDRPRTALAEWLTDSKNPLAARVWVNRIWQWHFGRGLVETSGDLGTQGTKPTDPKLLDFLASELIDNGWSTNHIHRLILNSATYRQSSTFSEANHSIDPDNQFLWRWMPRRLESESVRDSVLAVAGLLDSTSGGPSVATSSFRRSLYIKQKRDHLPNQQMLFDGAGAVASCSRRQVSTTPLQPLWLLNSTLMQQAAAALAERSQSVESAFKTSFSRPPREQELNTLNKLAERHGLASACLAILNSSEFLYLP